MSLAIDIIEEHSPRAGLQPGDIVSVFVDQVYLQDGNAPTIQKIFKNYGFDRIFDRSKVAVFFDHSVMSAGIEISDRLKEARQFCRNHQLFLFDHGEGISHLVAVEQGWFRPGSLVVATDSHTCTGGVMQSLALGMGASDIAAAMVTGRTWLKVPETVTIKTVGHPRSSTCAKDVILHAMHQFGNQSLLYKSLEWCGDWVEELPLDEASTVANMGVEMGAKCVFLPPRLGAPAGMRKIQESDTTYFIDINDLPPLIAKPHSPFNIHTVDSNFDQKVDYVFVGSCANSRVSDIVEVATILKGRKIDPDIKLVVTPGSKLIYQEALANGAVQEIIQSGGLVTPPGCGACVGTQGPIPASGDIVLSTMNRNFLGRMGNAKAEIWLCSPVVAAYTALKGAIPSVEEIEHDLRSSQHNTH